MISWGAGLLAAVAGIMVVAGLLVHPYTVPAAAATEACLEEYGLEAPGTAMPVIIVHGFRSSAEDMGDLGNGILDATRTEFSVTRFDYEQFNLEWVDHDGIGGQLRRQLVCLADASLAGGGIGRVGLVGHSMGGLAIRVALDGGPDEPVLSDEIALVVTLGTPHGGSRFGTSTRRIDFARALHAQASQLEARQIRQRGHLSSLGAAIAADHLVGWGASPAGRALRSSDALEALPPVPEGVPVLSVAADYVEEPRLLFYTQAPIHHGDLVVSAESARQHAREVDGLGGVQTHRCYVPSALNPVGGLAELAVLWRSDQRLLDCWHSSIVSVEPTTTRAVAQLIAASGREPRQPTPDTGSEATSNRKAALDLVDRWRTENETCRGESDPALWQPACNRRADADDALHELGWCLQAVPDGAGSYWEPCTGSPPPREPPHRYEVGPGSHVSADAEQCADATPDISDGDAAIELAARCLDHARLQNDLELAARFAEPAAIEVAFASERRVPWEFRGCETGAADALGLHGSWLGWVCTFNEPSEEVDAPHGTLRGMTFVAFDDVVVVVDIAPIN